MAEKDDNLFKCLYLDFFFLLILISVEPFKCISVEYHSEKERLCENVLAGSLKC